MLTRHCTWKHMQDNYYTCYLESNKKSKIQLEVKFQFNDLADNVRHTDGKSDIDVEALAFINIPLTDFPMGIEQKFCNLFAIEMQNCGIVSITKDHLKPLKMLRNLHLHKNRIKVLPRDLFIYTPSIEILSFEDNKIVHISEKTLSNLTKLIYADFRGNVNIDLLFSAGAAGEEETEIASMETLMKQIKTSCQPPSQTSAVANYVSTLWSTGMFSDFKIRTDIDEFHVHKCILAVNSPVFDAMFKYEMKENMTNEMDIKDVAADSVKEFLEFVYLRKAPDNSVNAMDLLTISTKYQFNELMDLSEALIIDAMEVENAYEILVVACRYSNTHLKTSAFDFISSNMFSGRNLPTELMEKPDEIKELIDAKQLMDEHVSNAQNEFEKVYDKFCGPNTD